MEAIENKTNTDKGNTSFKSKGFIGLFARHKVAPNLLMFIMIILGFVALTKMNVQFFPKFALDYVTVEIVWSGANAEDVESSITNPVERALRNLDGLDEMKSTSSTGQSTVVLKFVEGTDMISALDQVNQQISELRGLPSDIEKPVVERVLRYEPVARLLVIGKSASTTVQELKALTRQFEQELLQKGIDKISFSGMPVEEMAIEVSQESLEHYQLSFEQIASQIAGMSIDIPVGSVGELDSIRELRAIQQRRSEAEFSDIHIVSSATENVTLSDLATVTKRAVKDSPFLKVDGYPAIEMLLERSENGDTLKSSKIMQDWLLDIKPTLPEGVEIVVYDEAWSLVSQRINLLLTNGLGGLVLVILILYLFMNGRVAFWVAVGIPVSFLATLMVMYLMGGSINMVSLFALIMALGIIVDDAIVVGEDALSHFEKGEPPLQAAEGGAHRMFAPVVAASLTTIAAFVPLMMIGGEIGSVLFAIPMVIIAVIIASLIESFIILPGHLRHAFSKIKPVNKNSLRFKIDQKIDYVREHQFRQLIVWSLEHRAIVIAITLGMMIFVIGLLAGGRLSFVFFPSPESTKLNANARFVAGTPAEVSANYVEKLYQAMREAEAELDPGIIKVAVVHYNATDRQQGANFSSISVELTEPDEREVRNAEFVKVWKEKVGQVPGLDTLSIEEPKAGPPGADLDIRLWGASPAKLKQASLVLQEHLSQTKGVNGVRDDLPFGRNQMIYELSPEGIALGFTYLDLGRQLSAAFSGKLVQVYTQGQDEIEVRLQFLQSQQASLATLNQMKVVSPSGTRVHLNSVVNWKSQQGFDVVRHVDGVLAVTVLGEVDRRLNNANKILDNLENTLLPELVAKYGLSYSLEGQSANQAETFADMGLGLIVGLVSIYIILAWVFSSYGWPLVVMMAIPFGLVGAILGHWWMGLDMTILSIFGFFALSGIVVNDSIILISFYKRLREEGMGVNEALEEAAVQRVRAVLLTSLTTIAGLTPLLFETSLQAQFLIPMAASIAFGLAFSTMLILLVIPSALSLYESLHESRFENKNNKIA